MPTAPMLASSELSSHKAAGVKEAIEAAGATLVYLPPYSPDFNPIEMAYAKLKWLVRSAGQTTIEALWRFLGQSLDNHMYIPLTTYAKIFGLSMTAT